MDSSGLNQVWRVAVYVHATGDEIDGVAERLGAAICPDSWHESYCPIPWSTETTKLEGADAVVWEEHFADERAAADAAGDASPHVSTSASAVLKSMVVMFSTGDMSGLEATVAPDYVDHQGLGGEPIHGAEGFATVVATVRAAYRSLDVTVEDLIVGDDRAAARLRWRGIGPSGEHVERETLEIVRVEDGRAVEHWGGRS